MIVVVFVNLIFYFKEIIAPSEKEIGRSKVKIAICDDEQEYREQIREYLIEYKKEKNISLYIKEFESGDTLAESGEAFNMVFLDYCMKGHNGIESAKAIRKKDLRCGIVFVTAYPDFVFDSFEVQPFRFLLKPLAKEKIFEAIDSYIAQMKVAMPITVIEEGCRISVLTDDIVYAEADGKNCYIHTRSKTYHSSSTLAKLQEILPESAFYRIHKSYLINMYCVTMIDGKLVTMINGRTLPVSRTKCKDFKDHYMTFVADNYLRI